MDRDILPMAMNLARRLGPPPPEIMAALGLAPPRARGRDEDERDADSDGSVDTLGEPRNRDANRDRDPYYEGPRTGAERYPWRSAGFSSRHTGTATAQDTLDLEIDAQQTWTALERMRKWKDRLHRENKTLRSEVERLKSEVKEGRKREAEGKKEVERLKARYEEVWNDKVMLAEKISVSSLSSAKRTDIHHPR
jgi:regulator of replication initiation timing